MKKPFLFLSLTLFVFAASCNRQPMPEGMPPLVPLTLTVTQMNDPLTEASVVLYPDGTATNWTFGGKTDSKGLCIVYTRGKYYGVPAGKYRVTIDHTMSDVPLPKTATDAEFAEHDRKYPTYRTVPKEYTSSDKTPLAIEVTEGKNRLNLEIPEKVKEILKTSL